VADAAAHAAAMAQAIKASGVLVKVNAPEFARIVGRQDEPLVVRAQRGVFKKYWRYLTGYKGLAFFADSPDPLPLPGRAEVFDAKEIWIPG
jgi:hypothetical protein